MLTCRYGHIHIIFLRTPFFNGLLMRLTVFLQEIQSGDHHKAVLGRKVSMCSYIFIHVSSRWVFFLRQSGHLTYTSLFFKTLPPAAASVTQMTQSARTQMWRTKWQYVSTPFPYSSSHPQLSCQTAQSHSCFCCHAKIFSVCISSHLYLKVFWPWVHPRTVWLFLHG